MAFSSWFQVKEGRTKIRKPFNFLPNCDSMGMTDMGAMVRLPELVALEVAGESSTFTLDLVIVLLYTQSLKSFFFFFNWGITALQCWVSFW